MRLKATNICAGLHENYKASILLNVLYRCESCASTFRRRLLRASSLRLLGVESTLGHTVTPVGDPTKDTNEDERDE